MTPEILRRRTLPNPKHFYNISNHENEGNFLSPPTFLLHGTDILDSIFQMGKSIQNPFFFLNFRIQKVGCAWPIGGWNKKFTKMEGLWTLDADLFHRKAFFLFYFIYLRNKDFNWYERVTLHTSSISLFPSPNGT